LDISNIKKRLALTKFSVPDQSFYMQFVSLIPYTRYYIIFDTLDYTQFCKQDGKSIGASLISDGYGKLNFTFYWSRQNQDVLLQNKTLGNIFNNSSGNKILTITNFSGTSVGSKTIQLINNTPDIMFTKYINASNIVKN